MTTFKDSQNNEWTLKLNPLLVRSTHKLTGVHLTNLEADPFSKLEADPLLLCDVLWCLCEDQAKTRNVTAEQFYQLLEGEQIAAAADALEQAIVFFSLPAKRSTLRGVLEKNRILRQKAMDTAMSRLEDPATEQRILTALSQEAERAISRALESSSSGTSEANASAT